MNYKTKYKIEVILAIFFTFAIVIVAPMILNQIPNDNEKMMMKPLIYILLVLIPVIVCKIMKTSIGTLGFKKNEITRQLLIGFEIFIILAIIFSIAVFILGDNKGILLSPKKNEIGMILFYIVFNMVFVGLGEELLFRGYFMERFHTIFNSYKLAIVISALMFGIWHFPNGQDFLQVLFTALIGAIYGLAKYKIKKCSTLSLGIAHGLHDVYLLILSNLML